MEPNYVAVRSIFQCMLNDANAIKWGNKPVYDLSLCHGICTNFILYGAALEITLWGPERLLMSRLFGLWPQHSGNDTFPIDPPWHQKLLGTNAQDYYTGDLWSGRKGRKRRELLQFMLNKLDRLIKDKEL